ncbi:uncharacterized protein M6B38_119725 [Iris pallida]|uniref:J domain-containing protein n=1 Tax=Iris pallida TaxID=29817 RepID=A0AAX6HA45_IRIPA|nr:uncharacterized protein M6B38_119725 [Iris pallida]
MQSLHLLCRSSASSSSSGAAGGGRFGAAGIFPHSRALASLVGTWAHFDRRVRRPAGRTAPAASAAGSVCRAGGERRRDHYAVLGVSRSATAVEVKRAYRLLARKYHPDVSRDSQDGEVFKSIRMAYEVLSDEVARARYDTMLKFPEARSNSQRRRSTYYSEYARWADLRKQMQADQDEDTSWYHHQDSYGATAAHARGSFGEVLRLAFFTLLFMRMVGHRASLALCGAAVLLDQQLDFGYKMGYVVAWISGGPAGVLLALCIYFASWLCGKKSSGLVALVVVAAWVARFVPIPQGALLALLYMSMKLQVDSEYSRDS